jgi:hypothetical protein
MGFCTFNTVGSLRLGKVNISVCVNSIRIWEGYRLCSWSGYNIGLLTRCDCCIK